MDKKIALITGVTGQDGFFLSRFLESRGFEVLGTSRSAICDNKRLFSVSNPEELGQLIKVKKPDYLFHLSGQSSVGKSFEMEVETYQSFNNPLLEIYAAVKKYSPRTKVFNAASSEIFGNLELGTKADETFPHYPTSPYALAKSSSFRITEYYRDVEGLYCVNGVLFNHESYKRGSQYVTSKIIRSAIEIQNGSVDYLELGNIDISRDWGCAQEFVEAMALMLELEVPQDLVVCTGTSVKLTDFISYAFELLGLDYQNHLRVNPELYRPADIVYNCGNPLKAEKLIGWKARSDYRGTIRRLIEDYKRESMGL